MLTELEKLKLELETAHCYMDLLDSGCRTRTDGTPYALTERLVNYINEKIKRDDLIKEILEMDFNPRENVVDFVMRLKMTCLKSE